MGVGLGIDFFLKEQVTEPGISDKLPNESDSLVQLKLLVFVTLHLTVEVVTSFGVLSMEFVATLPDVGSIFVLFFLGVMNVKQISHGLKVFQLTFNTSPYLAIKRFFSIKKQALTVSEELVTILLRLLKISQESFLLSLEFP